MATQQAPNSSAPLNSNKISIITKSEIRYEGILYHINPQDQNITLCNVISFGTEGRRPGDEIAPSPSVHEYIIFRGTDIKDLKVLEAAPQPQGNFPTDEKAQKQAPETQAPKPQTTKEPSNEPKMKGNDEDFDFQAMQQKFQQLAMEHKQADTQTKAYRHDDFFDSLSTSTADKAKDQPFDRVAQKKLDKETFGNEYVDNASRGRGGGRRGGRGGRGYRGGGRGGNYRGGGGHNRNYGGGQGGYGGNQGGYGGNQGGYGGGHGGQGGYGGGRGGYGGGQGGYGGQNRKYGGGGQGGYGGGQGGYGDGQGGRGGYGGGRGGRGGYGDDEGYGDQGGYHQGGGRGGRGGYNSGPRYYKTYQTVDHSHDQNQQEK